MAPNPTPRPARPKSILELDVGPHLRRGGRAFVKWLRSKPLLQFGAILTVVIGYGFHADWQLNGNREWKWTYRGAQYVPDYLFYSVWNYLPGMAACGLLFWLVKSVRLRKGTRTGLLLALLVGWGWHYHAVSWPTLHSVGPAMLGGTMLNYPATGYLQTAIQIDEGKYPPIREMLRDYHGQLPRLDMHPKTHPPGNVLLSYIALAAVRDHPAAMSAVRRVCGWMGVVFSDSFMTMENWREIDQAAAMEMGLLMVIAALLSAPPLFALVRRETGDERTAWFAAILWLHYPGLVCFTPAFDQLYAAIAIASFWAWRRAIDKHPRWNGALAGLFCALGLFTTFKMFLWFVALGLYVVCEAVRRAGTWRGLPGWLARPSPERGRWIDAAASAAYAFIAFNGAIWAIWGIVMPAIFLQASYNQELLTVGIGRTYWIWLGWGVFDVLLFAGPALTILACSTWKRMFAAPGKPAAAMAPCLLIFPLALVYITLSGLVLGENARQLLMLGPGIAWAGAAWLRRPGATQDIASLAVLVAIQHLFTALALNTMNFIAHY